MYSNDFGSNNQNYFLKKGINNKKTARTPATVDTKLKPIQNYNGFQINNIVDLFDNTLIPSVERSPIDEFEDFIRYTYNVPFINDNCLYEIHANSTIANGTTDSFVAVTTFSLNVDPENTVATGGYEDETSAQTSSFFSISDSSKEPQRHEFYTTSLRAILYGSDIPTVNGTKQITFDLAGSRSFALRNISLTLIEYISPGQDITETESAIVYNNISQTEGSNIITTSINNFP